MIRGTKKEMRPVHGGRLGEPAEVCKSPSRALLQQGLGGFVAALKGDVALQCRVRQQVRFVVLIVGLAGVRDVFVQVRCESQNAAVQGRLVERLIEPKQAPCAHLVVLPRAVGGQRPDQQCRGPRQLVQAEMIPREGDGGVRYPVRRHPAGRCPEFCRWASRP